MPPDDSPDRSTRVDIISAVQTPLGFFALVVLAVEVVLGGIVGFGNVHQTVAGIVVIGMLLLLFCLVAVVAGMAIRYPDKLGMKLASAPKAKPEEEAEGPADQPVETMEEEGAEQKPEQQVTEEEQRQEERELETKIKERVIRYQDILGADAPMPSIDLWYTQLRPVLYQAAEYTVPTYYLDVDLNVIDWNVAFGMIFSDVAGRIRYQHVNYFIACLENDIEVFDHGRRFTERVLAGALPFVDTEVLRYKSARYGEIVFLKVASQLHDPAGELRGWSVSLLIRQIQWGKFERDLRRRIHNDKLWSVYSASYDRVLNEFPPYQTLIQDVIKVVPHVPGLSVADLGAGTGNVTQALLEAGHRVTAVDNSAAMLDRLRAKAFDPQRVTVAKASVEHLDALRILQDESFDAAVLVNVLYGVDDPVRCLRGVHRILKPKGLLAYSTTHSETRLDPLLNAIKTKLIEDGKFEKLEEDYQNLHEANKELERTVVRRYRRDQYREWTKAAGFDIKLDVPSTYVDALMLIHAQKK